MKKFIVSFKESGLRLDKALSVLNPALSRSYIASILKEGKILVNNKREKASYKVKENDEIILEDIPISKSDIKKEDIPLDIVYEDDDILIINKPQGMVVHPANVYSSGTLVNALLYREDKLSTINGVVRPGIVHRLDKDTSGLLCVAKNDNAHQFLSRQLQNRTMSREYIALVRGVIKENSGTIEMPIGRDPKNRQKMAALKEGKPAITNFVVLKRYQEHTLVKCQLVSGRTHQIRVHLSTIGYPIEGDSLYVGKGYDKLYKKGQLLTAYKLKLIHPSTKKEMVFEIDIPQYFNEVLKTLE
ncbi:MAG TPA: RluA family pseudouridine synthase [Erysipelotrichaceae bacterium]|nr:RluA family pseudouridine synthase [Erysipelotrichaceae bacterium]